MQPIDLQLYINSTARYLVIVDLLFSMGQDHKWNTIIKCSGIITGKLYTDTNNFKQELGPNEQSTSP